MVENNANIMYSLLEKALSTGFFLPKSLKKKMVPIMELIISRFFFLINFISLPVYQVRGNEKNSGKNLSILFVGEELSLIYISNLLFKNKINKKKIDQIFVWRVNKYLKNHSKEADIIIINTDRFFSRFIEKNCQFIIPEWVSLLLDTSGSLEDIESGFSRGARTDVKRIKKMNYSYEVSNDPEKLLFFYNRMFLPYISTKHGEEIHNSYYKYIKTLLDRVSVLLVKDGDKFVCGGLIESKGKKAQLPSMGILDGEMKYLIRGASAALFYFHIISAKKNGINLLNYGDARPFVNDGGFQFKRKWGMKVVVSRFQFGLFGIKLNNLNENVLSFLKNNPFMYLDKNMLKCYIIEDKRILNSKDVYRLFKSHHSKGVSELCIASLDGFADDVKDFNLDGFHSKLAHDKFIDKEIDVLIIDKIED